MQVEIHGKPVFSYLKILLSPGEKIYSESGAMVSMSREVDLQARVPGGFFNGLIRKFLGKESFFINEFRNPTKSQASLVLTQTTPGEVQEINLNGQTIYVEPGSYVASTEGIDIRTRWAGFASWFGGEGLFKVAISGKGMVWIGSFGALVHKKFKGSVVVDSGHLVAYTPGVTLHVQLAAGIFSSFFGGEGFVTRLEGEGDIWLQTRNTDTLTKWLNSIY